MKYSVQELIDIVRVETENEDVSDTIGIQDSEITRFLNIGQRQIQSKVAARSPESYSAIATLTADENTENRIFSIPNDSYMRSTLDMVWVDGQPKKQVLAHNLNMKSNSCCNSNTCGFICYKYKENGYAIVGNKIHITGHCARESEIKVKYTKVVPELQPALLEISPVTGVNLKGGEFPVDPSVSFDSNKIKPAKRYSLVDSNGDQVATNVKINSYDSSLGLLTFSTQNVDSLLTTTENLYLMEGGNSSNYCFLDPMVQDYITRYAIAKVLQRDGSAEYNVHSIDLVAILNEILDSYSLNAPTTIPQYDED